MIPKNNSFAQDLPEDKLPLNPPHIDEDEVAPTGEDYNAQLNQNNRRIRVSWK